MGCDFPLKAWRTPPGSDQALTFNPMKALNSTNSMNLPCGRCIGCRLERARQWAVRCQHEAKFYEHNCFVTLTYSDEHLPPDFGVHPKTLQLFMRRVRKHYRLSHKLRFFGCGEYGDKNLRPHYHLILFNHAFPDQKFYKKTPTGDDLFTSATLNKLWPYGLATLGNVTFLSAGYVARYNMKKIYGNDEKSLQLAADHYARRHPITGLIHQVNKEFLQMSRKPGIGRNYVDKFKSDFFPSDQVVVEGYPQRPPRFYTLQLTEEEQEQLKQSRRSGAREYKQHDSNRRRVARATVRDARISTLGKKL